MCFCGTRITLLRRPGSHFVGEACCIWDGRCLPFKFRFSLESSTRQWGRILAVLLALAVGPSLGNIGLARWNGSPGSSRKLPGRLPRQEIKNNPVLFWCLCWAGSLPSSWFWLWDLGLLEAASVSSIRWGHWCPPAEWLPELSLPNESSW